MTENRALRILSVNLCGRRAHQASLADMLDRLRPDVVAAQELEPETASVLEASFPHGIIRPARDATGMGLVTRRPASTFLLSLPYRPAQGVVLDSEDWPGLPVGVEVLNVHMALPWLPPLWRPPRGSRRGQLRGLLEYLDDRPGRVRALVGDFNALPGTPLHRRLAKRLHDGPARLARARRSRSGATWGPWKRGGGRLLRIDHGFLSGLRAVHSQVMTLRGSDHGALLLDVAVGTPGTESAGDAERDELSLP